MIILARICPDDPPSAWLGIDMDWPLRKKTLGTTVTYICPFMTKTNLEELAGDIFKAASTDFNLCTLILSMTKILVRLASSRSAFYKLL